MRLEHPISGHSQDFSVWADLPVHWHLGEVQQRAPFDYLRVGALKRYLSSDRETGSTEDADSGLWRDLWHQ